MSLVPQRLFLVGLVAMVATAGGCTGAPTAAPPDSPPPVTAVPTVTPGSVVTLPLDAYAFSATDAATVTRALGILEQKCMAKLGFTTWTPPKAEPTADDPSSLAGFPYRPATAVEAASVGYRKPPPPATGGTTGGNRPSDAEMLALYGFVAGKQTPPADAHGGGCIRTAFDELNKGRPAFDEEFFGRLKQDASNGARADSRLQAAYVTWSACMKQGGFDYATPADAAGHSWPPEKAGSLEIATATADVQCRQQTNLLGVWLAVLSAYEQKLVDANGTKLAAIKDAIRFEVEHAAAVVAGS